MLEFWARFGNSPLFTGITWAMVLSYLVYFMLMFTYRMSVRGTRRSYMAASMLNALGPSLTAGYLFAAAVNIAAGMLVISLLDALIAFFVLRYWLTIKDENNWWKGRGTNVRRWIRSLSPGTKTAPAGAAG
ncbi:hypothetical protein ACFQ36_01140 [Arthrobacter sp. GCM10027362]|uniref:hypothetical protein n=1 Tax=Arthrobacter sp. GCM10027362 TaxID=3273379 RepID=UPI00363E4092